MLSGKELPLKHNDKETINRIILENTIGSKYYENEKRKEAILNNKIEERKKQLQTITPKQIANAELKANAVLRELEKTRNLERIIVHIDMDAFYASVEQLSKPHLADLPMAVGSEHMLSTANYVARSYGVRSAMPGFIARKLCPSLIIVPLNFSEYDRLSSIVDTVLEKYNPHFDKVGLDEAYIDITEIVKERLRKKHEETVTNEETANDEEAANNEETANDCNGDWSFVSCFEKTEMAEIVVKEIRDAIKAATSLTASAGIAPNSMLAKVSSDMNKPNGQFTVAPNRDDVMKFVTSLPVRKINGIGRVTESLLKADEIKTCGDLIKKRALLYLSSSHNFEYLMRIGLGLGFDDGDKKCEDNEKKSSSVERTFDETSNIGELMEICYELSQSLCQDLVQQNLFAKCITLKLKSHDFKVTTRASSLATFTNDFDVIYRSSSALLKKEMGKSALNIRLMGVRASNLMRGKEKKVQKRILDLFNKKKSSNNGTLQGSVNKQNEQDDDNFHHINNKRIKLQNSTPPQNKETCATNISETSAVHLFNHKPHTKSYGEQDHQASNKNEDDDVTGSCQEQEGQIHQANNKDDDVTGSRCPICNITIATSCNAILNQHVDECLNIRFLNDQNNLT